MIVTTHEGLQWAQNYCKDEELFAAYEEAIRQIDNILEL